MTVTRGCPGVISNSLLHAVVQDYFLIHCHTQVSRIIFKLTVARRCPGVFSNSLTHAVVQDYFLIHCHTRVSRSMIDTVDTVDMTYDE